MVMFLFLAVLCGIISDSVVPVAGQYVSPWFHLKHWSSSMFVSPSDGICPMDGTTVVVRSDYPLTSKHKFRFVQVEGHFGYIEHACSKLLEPAGGSLTPGDDTKLQFTGNRHAGALFKFDEGAKLIMHRGGKMWHPYGGQSYPSQGTQLTVHSSTMDDARWQATDTSLTPISVYGGPLLFGNWRRIFAVLNPTTSYEHVLTFTVGKSVTSSLTINLAWSVSVEVAVKWFTAKAEFSGFVETSEQSTWNEESSRSTTIKVSPGETLVVWQYAFGAEQLGEKLLYQSTVLANTNDVNTPPNIIINKKK